MRRTDAGALALAGLLMFAGIAHFAAPDNFDTIIPHLLPGSRRAWTDASGAAEITLAVGVAWRVTRRFAATLTAVFLVLVFPANIQMAVDAASRTTSEFALALLRLPLPVPLIWWAWRVRNRATRTDRI